MANKFEDAFAEHLKKFADLIVDLHKNNFCKPTETKLKKLYKDSLKKLTCLSLPGET